MKPILSAVAVCLLGSVAWAQTQQPPPPPPPPAQQQQQQEQKKERQEVTLTGCLTQGSMPSVFVLENAKPAQGTTKETGARYIVVAEGANIDLRAHLNNEVQLMGAVEGTIPPPEKQTEEKDLPKLRTTSLSVISNTCAVN